MGLVLESPNSKRFENAKYEEFIQLFSRTRHRIFAYIFALVPHQADAEDVFQRSSLILWNKFSDFDRERPFLPWACSIAHYEVRNFLRSARRDRLYFDEELVEQIAVARTSKAVESENRLDALRLCMERLKTTERELIEQAYGSEFTIKEFAEASGVSPQTLYNRIGLARSKLSDCLKMRLASKGWAT